MSDQIVIELGLTQKQASILNWVLSSWLKSNRNYDIQEVYDNIAAVQKALE
jgi:hypothetical protein